MIIIKNHFFEIENFSNLIFYKRKMVYQHNMSQLSNILSNELKCISADIVNNIILHYLDVQTQKIICESNVRLKWLISQKNNLRLIKYNKIIYGYSYVNRYNFMILQQGTAALRYSI